MIKYIICLFLFVCFKSLGTNNILPQIDIDLICNTKDFKEYLKTKENFCDDIYSREYISYAYQCSRMNLTPYYEAECYAEINERISYLIDYCNKQEHCKEYKNRLIIK